jgi:serine/threonine-protein kinase
MGSVYIAEHALLKRRTAVKILSGDLSKENIARFEREVRSSSRLTHPNTIEIYDFGRTPEGVFYYAMEYVEGPTLSELVTRHGPLPPVRAVHVLKQVCASLGEAHCERLVHRDIKPQNIMLCTRGGRRDVVKVLDFGLVKDMAKAGSVELTTGMQIGGTPLYMAPERLTSPKRLDARVDVYSLGAVAYYLQTGRPVFETTNSQELIQKVMNDLPERPSKISPQAVPPELENLIMDCLAKDPEDRPQSVFAVLERLEKLSRLGTWTQEDAIDWWEHHNVA